MTTRQLVCKHPLSPLNTLATLSDDSYDIVRRECLELHAVEQAAWIKGGRILPGSNLWVPSRAAIRAEFPEEHKHGRGCDHRHNPLRPELDDHQHPTYFQTKAGILDIYRRMEFKELAFSIAPDLFDGPGLDWSYERRKLRLTEWRYLRRDRLIQAVATYEAALLPDEAARMRISYLWVPRQITEKMLLERWLGRYSELETISAYEIENGRANFWMNPDLLLPIMSGLVIICADRRTYDWARWVLRRVRLEMEDAVCWVWGPNKEDRLYEGTAIPVLANVADVFEDQKISSPEDICLGFGNVAQWDSGKRRRRKVPAAVARSAGLDSVLKVRLLSEVGDNRGFSKKNYLTACNSKESGARAGKALESLVENEYLVAVPFVPNVGGKAVFDVQEIERLKGEAEAKGGKLDIDQMHYWTDKTAKYASEVSRQSGKDLAIRHQGLQKQDHRDKRPHRLHTLMENETVATLRGLGFEADSGYRYLVNVPNVTQIPPDAVVWGTYAYGAYVVERVIAQGTVAEMRNRIRKVLVGQAQAVLEGNSKPLALLYDSRITGRLILEQVRDVSATLQVDLDGRAFKQNMFVVSAPVEEGVPNPLHILFRTSRFDIETERSAKWADRIKKKFSTRIKLAQSTGVSGEVIYICETEGAAARFQEATERMIREAGVDLTVVITTMRGFRTKRLTGPESVLRRQGRPFSLFTDVDAAKAFWKFED